MPSELTFEHFDEKVADAFVRMPSHTALPDFLGVSFTEAGPGHLVAEMEVRSELLTPFGNLHGGVIAVLVDHVLGSVMYPVMPRGWWAATTEYKVNNVAPVRSGGLRAEATIIAMTKRTSVVRIDVTNDGRLVCVAQGTCLLQEPKLREEAPAKPEEVPQRAPAPSGASELDILDQQAESPDGGQEPSREGGTDPMSLFDRASTWTAAKVAGARTALEAETPCDRWTVRDLINHLLDGNRYFEAAARGETPAPPSDPPEDRMGDDPAVAYEEACRATMSAYGQPGVLEKMGLSLGIAFVDQLVHGWDLAKATGQDTTMPPDLAEAAFRMVDGRLTDDQRGRFFKPAVPVTDDASPQDRLLAYSGRLP